jgi:hypothetical protein
MTFRQYVVKQGSIECKDLPTFLEIYRIMKQEEEAVEGPSVPFIEYLIHQNETTTITIRAFTRPIDSRLYAYQRTNSQVVSGSPPYQHD